MLRFETLSCCLDHTPVPVVSSLGLPSSSLPPSLSHRPPSAKCVHVSVGGVRYAASLRRSVAWPALGDPWFVTRVLAPLSWWTNAQLADFRDVTNAVDGVNPEAAWSQSMGR